MANRKKEANLQISYEGPKNHAPYANSINFNNEDEEDEDNSLLSRLMSQRKSIDGQNYFNAVPDEIFTMIFQKLDLESLCKVGFVCKSWYQISNDQYIWTQRIEEKFGAIETSKIQDKKRWFLYKLCIESHYKDIKNMDPAARLDFSFEERLFYNQISFKTWGVALKLLHSPLQNNVTIGAIILQTILIYLKLEGVFQYQWFFVFAPMWVFNTIYICSCVVWFYLHARDLLTEEFVEKKLSGWLKDVLDALRTRFLDYLLFILVSSAIFMVFPSLLILQLDVFSRLFVQNDSQSDSQLYFKPYRLPWTIIAFPLLLGFGIIWLSIRRRIRYNKRRRHYKSLPLLYLIWFVFLWAFLLVLFTALQLDDLLPSFWNCYWTATPVWLLDLSALAYLAGVFNFNPVNGQWLRSIEISARFIAESPLILLMWIFQMFLCNRLQYIYMAYKTLEDLNSTSEQKTDALETFNESFFRCFAYLFAVEGFAILAWLQDVVDFGGYRKYSVSKRFDFSIKKAVQQNERLR